MADILGQAIYDFYHRRRRARLWVHDEHGPNLEMPVGAYFRSEAKLPALERRALAACRGRVLDIGAGAGSHALILQERGHQVTAIDIAPLAVRVMQERGVIDARVQDVFTFTGERFDTLLLLMNGIGVCGTIGGLKKFLRQARHLLAPGGRLIFDSSDVAYLYEEEPFPMDRYYGEIKCRYEYKRKHSPWLTWLYIDQQYLTELAERAGWTPDLLFEDNNNQYLMQLTYDASSSVEAP